MFIRGLADFAMLCKSQKIVFYLLLLTGFTAKVALKINTSKKK